MQREKWDLLFALAEEQHAAFTSAQAAELGFDSHALRRAQRDRLIDLVRPRVWAVVSLLDDWTVMAALQLAQPRAVAGLRAAAALLGFDGVDAIAMDVLVPRNVWLRGPNVHRTDDLVVPEIIIVDGLRCTEPVRTLIDWAGVVDDEHLERGMESVFRRDPSARRRLVERASALSRPGRSGPSAALRVERLLPETRTESDLETVYWQELRRHGVPLPERQVPVGRFRLDQAYTDIKLFIELDGYAAHGTREAFIRDRHRQNFVVGQDWTPLREVTRRRARLVVPAGV